MGESLLLKTPRALGELAKKGRAHTAPLSEEYTGIQSEGSVSEEAPDLQTGYAGTPDA